MLDHKIGIFVGGFILGCCSTWANMNMHSLWISVSDSFSPKQPHTVEHPQSLDDSNRCIPQVFNFMKEFGCREGHLAVPKILVQSDLSYGKGKVVVDIGLFDGQEFFAAIDSGYTVYGFEANPGVIPNLRKKCEEYDGKARGELKCIYVNANNITEHLHASPFTSYLIEGGAGSSRSVLNMSIAGPGSSFAEDAPIKRDQLYEMVTMIPVHDVVGTDVYLFKVDVQGFEYDVLKGSKTIFDQRIVKTMLMELYPRGLGNAGTDFDEFLNFLWHDLGMLCSSASRKHLISDASSEFFI